MVSANFYPLRLRYDSIRTYLFALIFAAGNLLLPQLAHLVPKGGFIFLPIYFFTLIAAYKFGFAVGLLTAVLSPLLNHLFFGMPPAFVLPAILIKSVLLSFIAAMVAEKSKKLSLLHLLFVVAAYQLIGSLAEWAITGELSKAVQDFRIGLPGMLIQIFVGWAFLKMMAEYGAKNN